jgi:hypothetical protein
LRHSDRLISLFGREKHQQVAETSTKHSPNYNEIQFLSKLPSAIVERVEDFNAKLQLHMFLWGLIRATKDGGKQRKRFGCAMGNSKNCFEARAKSRSSRFEVEKYSEKLWKKCEWSWEIGGGVKVMSHEGL